MAIAIQKQKQIQKQGTTVATQPRAERATPRRKRVNPEEKRAIISSVALALREKNYPSIPERVKDILASQIGDCLRGGFEFDDVRKMAVELALAWDEKRGHNRLCHLSSRVRAAYWSAEQKKHDAIKAGEVSPEMAAVLPSKSMSDKRFIHPNNHSFVWDSSTSCRICGGPPGVHVRRVGEVV